MRRVEQCVLDELLLDGDLETSLLLLELGYDVLHVLFDLVLLFDLKAVGRIGRQLWMELVLLLAHKHLQVVQLRRLKIALNLGNLISQLTLISLDLDQAVQV